MPNSVIRLAHLFCFLLILFMTFQVVIFRQYAFEVTWLYSKEAMGISNPYDQRKLGAICNTIGRYNCSVRIFSELQKKWPGDTEVLSNLAMALTLSNNEAEAFPYFKAYFSSGGKAFDVMYWYGKALKSSGANQEALTWFYNVIYYKPDDIDAAKELVSTLVTLNRPVEALSFIASLIDHKRDDESSELWMSELKNLEDPVRRMASEKLSGVEENLKNEDVEFKLPSLDGRRFFVPFKTRQGDFHFIVADENSSDFTISTEDIKFLGWSYSKISDSVAMVHKAHIGPLEIKNFEVSLCKSCSSHIGNRFLTSFNARIDGRGKIPYLILQREKYE